MGGFFWFFAIAGVEKRIRSAEEPSPPGLASLQAAAISAPNFLATFGRIWADGRTRRFFIFLAVAGLAGQATLTRIALVIFGGGFGIYTFGGLNLMAVMSSDQGAGAYLGLWTVAILLFKGVGTALEGSAQSH